MGINIRNDRAEKLARQVAAETGESLTDAIIHSLEERLERIKGRRSAPDLAETLIGWERLYGPFVARRRGEVQGAMARPWLRTDSTEIRMVLGLGWHVVRQLERIPSAT